MDEAPNLVWAQRQLVDLDGEGLKRIEDGVGQRARYRRRDTFAEPARAERRVRAGLTGIEIDIDVGDIGRGRQFLIFEIRRQLLAVLIVNKLLEHRVRHTLHDFAVELSLDDLRIDHGADFL